ncbi:barstar family protein [Dyadobacter psychrotolerans]|nr:ribonuclease inhibitor [Dyadobacter psychrotolerans]
MKKKQIKINGNNFSDLTGFYQEINRLFMHGMDWEMGHSLDALNDILYGGFGVYDPGETVTVIWQNTSKSRADLGREETRKNYEMKIKKGYPYNVKLFEEKLLEIENGNGQTLFDIITEIFRDHKNIDLSLEV